MNKYKTFTVTIIGILVAVLSVGILAYFIKIKVQQKKAKNPQIIHSKFYYDVLNSETAFKDAVVIAEANLQNEKLIRDLYANLSGAYGDYFVWGANYDSKTSTFTLKTLELVGIGSDEIPCWKPLGTYKIPLNTFNFYSEGDSVSQNHFDIACFDNYKHENALSIENEISIDGIHLSKKLVGNTLVYKGPKDNEVIKMISDTSNHQFLYSDVNNPDDYTNVENFPNKMIYRNTKGQIIEIYEAEVVNGRYNNPVISRITVSDKNGNVKKIVVFDKSTNSYDGR